MKRLLPVLMMVFGVFLASAGEGFALPVCEGSPLTGTASDVRSWNNCSGTHIWGPNTKSAGDICICEWKNGRPHGQGTFTTANGSKYVGEFKDGKYHGQGTETYANGDKYVGGRV